MHIKLLNNSILKQNSPTYSTVVVADTCPCGDIESKSTHTHTRGLATPPCLLEAPNKERKKLLGDGDGVSVCKHRQVHDLTNIKETKSGRVVSLDMMVLKGTLELFIGANVAGTK